MQMNQSALNSSMMMTLPTVLLVDDEPDITETLSALLSVYGYSTRTANSVSEAHEILKEEGVDVILSDIMMPKLRGTMLRPLMKADPRFSHIPIIFMTGHDFNGEQLDERILAKPFSAQDMLSAIQFATKKAN